MFIQSFMNYLINLSRFSLFPPFILPLFFLSNKKYYSPQVNLPTEYFYFHGLSVLIPQVTCCKHGLVMILALDFIFLQCRQLCQNCICISFRCSMEDTYKARHNGCLTSSVLKVIKGLTFKAHHSSVSGLRTNTTND